MPVTTIPTSRFDELVRPFAQELSPVIARRLVRRAAILFCECTNCWREVLTLDVDESNEAIVTPAYATVHRIEEATYGDREYELEPTQFTDTGSMEPGAMPRYITQSTPNTISLIPPPSETITITLSLFLKPIEGTAMGVDAIDALDVVPEFLLLQYGQQIAWGALSQALGMREAPHYDPQTAAMYEAKFKEAREQNFASNITMQHRPPSRTRMSEY